MSYSIIKLPSGWRSPTTKLFAHSLPHLPLQTSSSAFISTSLTESESEGNTILTFAQLL